MAYMTKKQKRWRFVIPIIILLLFTVVLFYKLDFGKPYTVKLTLYNEDDKVYIVTSECVKTKLDHYANSGRESFAKLIGLKNDLRLVEVNDGCSPNELLAADD